MNGQISKVYFTKTGYALSNWTSAVEWNSRLDKDSAAADAIRPLIVIGELPAPTFTEKEISLGRLYSSPKKFTIPMDIDEVGDENYNMMRTLECNTGKYLLWFETRDGYLYGGNAGIEANLKVVGNIISKNYTDNQLIQLVAEWTSKFHPERVLSPIVDATGDQYL